MAFHQHYGCDICGKDQAYLHDPEQRIVVCNTCLRDHKIAIAGLGMVAGVSISSLDQIINRNDKAVFSHPDNIPILRKFIDGLKSKSVAPEQLTFAGIDLAVPQDDPKPAVDVLCKKRYYGTACNCGRCP